MTTRRMGPAVGGMRDAAFVAPTAVLIPTFGAVRVLAATRAAGEVRAPIGAVPLSATVLTYGEERLPTLGAGPRVGRLSPMPSAIVSVGVASPAGRDQVVRHVVGGVAVQMVRADRDPGQRHGTPVTRQRLSADLLVENDPADRDLPVATRERVMRQVPRWSSDSHSHHSSLPWRTTDPGQLAKAMRVPKPPPQTDGQLDLFGAGGTA